MHTPKPGNQEVIIKMLYEELATSNRESLKLIIELDKKLEARTSELRSTQKELEKTNCELLQLTLELEDRVNQRTSELQQTNDELITAKEKTEESDRLKTAFLQNMSHEIRTPMNGILGFTELLKNPNLSGEKRDDYIRIISQSGKRMLNIINDLIDLSKIETGQIKCMLAETNVNHLLRELYDFFKPEADEKSLSLICYTELPDDLSNLISDGNILSRILSNLLNNALKFTEKGTIAFGYLQKNNMLLFYVQDTGVGIPDDQKRIIFDRFIQGNMEITRNYEGAGIGLTITKAFVEKLGGRIWMESKIGEGTTFYFYLPFQLENKNIKTTNSNASLNKNTKPIEILIVEDDEASRMHLKELLAKENTSLFFAKNGKEAVEKVKSLHEIQILLIELKTPIADGFESIRKIKEINPELPIIAQSAYVFYDDIEKAKIAGCKDFIRKPINREVLLLLLNKHLSKLKVH